MKPDYSSGPGSSRYSRQGTKASGSQHFYDMPGSANRTLKLYEGGLYPRLDQLPCCCGGL